MPRRRTRTRRRFRRRGPYSRYGKKIVTARRAGAGYDKLFKPVSGLPRCQYVKLAYSESIKMAGSVDAYAIYCLNSIFDPQNTLGAGFLGNLNSNTQPLYRDQWATFYDQYRVYGARYTIRAYVGDDSGTVISNMRIVCWPDDTQTTGASSIMVDAERPYAQQMVATSGAAQGRKIGRYISTAQACSTTKKQVQVDNEFNATMGASPTRLAFLNIHCTDMDASGVTTNTSLYLDVKIIYYVQLYNRISVTGS